MSIHAFCVPLGKLAVVKAGYPFRCSIEGIHEGPVRAVQMKDMDPIGRSSLAGLSVRTRLTGRREADWLLAGDLLFVARGSRFYAACLGCAA